MIETIPRAELVADADKYLRLLKEKQDELKRELAKVRQEVAAMEQYKKWDDKLDTWAESGIPEPRRADPGQRDDARSGAGTQPPTRKARILALMGQDPHGKWKVFDVASALGEESKIKSVRVAMDEMAREGSLMKLPNAVYQFGVLPQN